MSGLFECLYISKLSVNANPRSVADIVRNARTKNRLHDITSLLVFDGLHFCQYLEGPQAQLTGLMRRISADPRHEELHIKQHGQHDNGRHFAECSLLYALDNSGKTIEQLVATEGHASTALLLQQLPLLDMELR